MKTKTKPKKKLSAIAKRNRQIKMLERKLFQAEASRDQAWNKVVYLNEFTLRTEKAILSIASAKYDLVTELKGIHLHIEMIQKHLGFKYDHEKGMVIVPTEIKINGVQNA